MEGYIKLDRKVVNWEWYQDSNTFRVFIHLLLNATHKDIRWKGIPINKGQLITGRKKLSTELKLSERSIRTCIERLISTNEITIETTNRFSIVTICKYVYYQSGENSNDQQNDQPPANKRPTNDHIQE